jgi:hypothetical protein
MVALLITLAVLAVLAAGGLFFGVDSRDGRDWRPYRWPGPHH